MANEPNPLAGIVVETKDIPTIYANHASPSISFNDIRIYLGEVVPKQLNAVQTTEAVKAESSVKTHICVAMSPEFAKALADSVLLAVQKFESVFGPLRTPVTPAQVSEKLLK